MFLQKGFYTSAQKLKLESPPRYPAYTLFLELKISTYFLNVSIPIKLLKFVLNTSLHSG